MLQEHNTGEYRKILIKAEYFRNGPLPTAIRTYTVQISHGTFLYSHITSEIFLKVALSAANINSGLGSGIAVVFLRSGLVMVA